MQQNLGRVVGSKWYTGTGITGTDTTPTVFSGSGVTYALLNDLYLNTTTGAVYQCDLKGSPTVAKWKFICNITGPTPELIDNLRSTDTTKALTANQGKVLNDKLLSSGIYPKSVDLDLETAVYMVDITVQNTDGTITFTSADDSGTYAFTKIGTADTYTITVDIDSSIGFTTTGAILTNVAFTNNIYAIELKDSNADTILEETFNAWEEIEKSLEQVKPSGVITDGALTLNQAKIQKEIDGTFKQVYPISHAKAVWYDKTNNQTIADKIGSGAGTANSLTYRQEITAVTDDMYASIFDGSFASVHTGMHYTAPSGRTFWLAHADYNYGMGSTGQDRHTMLVIEDDITITSAHHSTNTTEGGAVASDIYTTVLPAHQGELEEDFGAEHIIPQSIYLINAVTNGVASGGAWTSLYSSILTEKQIFGNDIRYTDGANYFLNFLTRERQLALFANMPETIIAHMAGTTNRVWYWTDTVESASYFGLANVGGGAGVNVAANVCGVRRVFFIG